jgi:Lrp/AsnC family leucine-responsive transcriptional regulator
LPHKLDKTDVAIIKSLMKDGRKSFREISRELSISTPTIKSRYQRLVNLGLIKSVSPIIDMKKIDKKIHKQISEDSVIKTPESHIHTGLAVNVNCDYCDGEITSQPKVLKFGRYERFFCCTSCQTLYKDKYGGRINSLSKQNLEK